MATNNQKNDDEIFQECIKFHQLGKLNDAKKGFEYLISKYPNSPDLLNSLGTLNLQLGYENNGITLLKKSLQINSNQPIVSFNLASSYENKKNYSKALEFFDMTIYRAPKYIEAYKKKGELLTNLKNHKEALNCFEKAIKLLPEDKTILNGIGVNYLELGDANNALKFFRKCINIDSTIAIFYNNVGLAEYKINAFQKSIKSFNEAIRLSPTTGYFYSNRGLSYQALKKLELATEDFNKSISIDPNYPDAYWNKSLINLYQGNYNEGWKLYEYRWQSFAKKSARSYSQKLWLGKESLEDKVIYVFPEQGHGDFILCFRYISLLKDLKPKKIILEVTEPFYELIRVQDEDIEVIQQNKKIPKFDFYCPIMSLPYAFKTDLSNIPSKNSYLSLNRLNELKDKINDNDKFKVGICWAGNPQHKNDHNRSMAMDEMIPLLSMPFEFHSLQKQIDLKNQKILKKYKIVDLHKKIDNFSDTATFVSMMDIVISVDTVIAHLAGALGKKTFLLLPNKSSFLWMDGRKDSPWYPTIKIFRQKSLGNWESPIGEIMKELKACYKNK